MAANIVSPAQSGRFYYGCAGAAGLLAGLAIVFWFPALARAGGRQIWCVSTTPCRMLCDSGWRVSRIFRWWPTPP